MLMAIFPLGVYGVWIFVCEFLIHSLLRSSCKYTLIFIYGCVYVFNGGNVFV